MLPSRLLRSKLKLSMLMANKPPPSASSNINVPEHGFVSQLVCTSVPHRPLIPRRNFTGFTYISTIKCLSGAKHICPQRSHFCPKRFYRENPYPLTRPMPKDLVAMRKVSPLPPKRGNFEEFVEGVLYLMGFCAVLTLCFGRLERIPYTNRLHFALADSLEERIAEYLWRYFLEDIEKDIVPFPDSRAIYIMSIAALIIHAMNAGLKLEKEHKINGSIVHVNVINSMLDDETFWVSESGELIGTETKAVGRKQAQEFTWKPTTKHLNGREWEIYVVDSYEANAVCVLGRRIIVYTGLLHLLGSDPAELATVIGHEIGHAVARHSAEGLVMVIWIFALLVILHVLASHLMSTGFGSRILSEINRGVVKLLRLYISRRREEEADYIGLMLMASAGYDPRVAPEVHKKLSEFSLRRSKGDLFSTHPSGDKRAKLLNEPEVMEGAIQIYKEAKAGIGVRIFV